MNSPSKKLMNPYVTKIAEIQRYCRTMQDLNQLKWVLSDSVIKHGGISTHTHTHTKTVMHNLCLTNTEITELQPHIPASNATQ